MNQLLPIVGLAIFPIAALCHQQTREPGLPETCHLIYDEAVQDEGWEVFPYRCEGPCEDPECEASGAPSVPAGAL